MTGLFKAIRKHLPSRRRRFWRYVSPGRRGAGIVLLATLLTLAYGYWYLTNDRVITIKAQQYLQSLTGTHVKISAAKFSLFGGISLKGVTIRLAGEQAAEPFFTAEAIELRHRPWSLFRGRLEPTEIVCVKPVLSLERDMTTGDVNASKLMPLVNQNSRSVNFDFDLPSIVLRDCAFRVNRVEAGLKQTQEKRLNISMVPSGREGYLIVFEVERTAGEALIEGSISLNFKTGEQIPSGTLPIEDTVIALPQKYIQWRNRYDIKGLVRFQGRPPQAPKDTWDFDLVDASMVLPAQEGGVNLDHVSGHLTIDAQGVTVKKLRGQIQQAGGGWVEINGRYNGFDADSWFSFELSGKGLLVPQWQQLGGDVAKSVKCLDDICHLEGRFDLQAKLERTAEGKFKYEGTAWPRGMSGKIIYFPYRLDEMTGEVSFNPTRIEINQLAGVHGKGRIKLNAEVSFQAGQTPYEVNIQGENIALDKDILNAMPRGPMAIYDKLNMTGSTGAVEARIIRPFDSHLDDVTVEVTLDGKAGMKHSEFAYPLENLAGQVNIHNHDVTLESLTGRHKAMHCRLSGSFNKINTHDQQINLDVTATQLPLDKTLALAMGQSGRDLFAMIGRPVDLPSSQPSSTSAPASTAEPAELPGQAVRLSGTVTQQSDEPLDYKLTAAVRDVTLIPRDFAYRIEQGTGVVTIMPGRVRLDGFTARHGDSTITGGGEILTGQKKPGLDLNLQAQSIAIDQELYNALPKGVQKVWQQLKPAGKADIGLELRLNLPDKPALDYKATVQAGDMEITCAEFPYTFRGVSGKAIATPGNVELVDVCSREGDASAGATGNIVSQDAGLSAKLEISAQKLPLTQVLLDALPKELSTLTSRFRVGGTCSANLTSLLIVKRDQPRSMPDDATTQPASQVAWSAKGSMYFDQAVVDIGQDPKKFSGSLTGYAARGGNGLELEALVEMASISVGPQEITEFRSRLAKSAKSSMIQIQNILGKVHGGQVAGEAEIKLSSPLEYGIRLDMEGVEIESLINAGQTDPARKHNVNGKLAGTVRYSSRPGARPAQQASGELRVTNARMGKLPVMLDMLHVMFLSLPNESAFNEGQVIYHLKDDKLVLQEVFLTGAAASVVGSGTLDVKNEKVNLVFLSTSGQLPRIRLLSELMDGISRELTEVHITGTLSKPKMTTVSFRGLREIIGTLQNPAQERP